MTTPAPLSYSTPKPTGLAEPVGIASDPTLLVEPDSVARRLGVALPLSATQRERVVDAIRDAQAEVEGELNRAIVPETRVFPNALPVIGGDPRTVTTWPALAVVDDRVSIASFTANTDGTFRLTVRVGLDGIKERPIVRYVTAAAVEALRHDPSVTPLLGEHRRVNSLSAEGQSITFEAAAPAANAEAGARPTLKSLRQYKRHAAYQRQTRPQPFPYFR